MVKIVPFQGYRYNKNKIPDFECVISPPYDVINTELQKKLHEASEYNVAHLIKGKKFASDTEENNEYIRAFKLLDAWIEKGVLIREEVSSFYVLAQDFEIFGERMTRTSLVALLKLEELCKSTDSEGTCKGVHQHEETLPKDIEDRLNLLRATKANFGLIFAIYSDKERLVDTILEDSMGKPHLMEITDAGVTHRLWTMDDENDIARIKEVLDDKYVIIADGHHRYKTALQHSKEHPGDESRGFRMIALVNTMNKGLVILPTHRLIQGIEGFEPKKLITALANDFDIEDFEYSAGDDKTARQAMFRRMEELFSTDKHAFGLYCRNGRYYTLVLKHENLMDGIQGYSDAWKRLDVTILHTLILEDQLGIDKDKLAAGTIEGGSYVEYIKAIGDAVAKSIDKVNEKGYQAVFFMNPTRIREVEDVATNHETMPQKSTFFYPKVYTGFVMHRL